tara:strand:+ start:1250 stop:1753 length:504 start_codon:yes stop_codon:yes gene_type:complete
MADKGVVSVSASVLSDISKMSIGSTMSYEPVDSGDKWVYTERVLNNASEPLLPTTQPYIDQYTNTGAQTTVASGDKYRLLVVKNTGTTDGSTSTTEGVVISLDADNAAYGEAEGVFIDAGDTWVSKFPATTQADVYAITVAVTSGAPSGAAGTDGVLCIIAAIMDDV